MLFFFMRRKRIKECD